LGHGAGAGNVQRFWVVEEQATINSAGQGRAQTSNASIKSMLSQLIDLLQNEKVAAG